MIRTSRRLLSSQPRNLSVLGALITGSVGVFMAVYSVFGGEDTGGAALLAASALAFGLLALSLDRTIAGPSRMHQRDSAADVGTASYNGHNVRLRKATGPGERLLSMLSR